MFLQTLQSRHVKASGTQGGYLQNIVKEGLTRKVFWNRDLAGPDCRPGLEVSAAMTLRCECARVHCALSTARVKVIRHMDGEWGCGKGWGSGCWRREKHYSFQLLAYFLGSEMRGPA